MRENTKTQLLPCSCGAVQERQDVGCISMSMKHVADVELVLAVAVVLLRGRFRLEAIIRLCKTTFYTGFNTAYYAKTYAKASFTQATKYEDM